VSWTRKVYHPTSGRVEKGRRKGMAKRMGEFVIENRGEKRVGAVASERREWAPIRRGGSGRPNWCNEGGKVFMATGRERTLP